jgi:hypothetical protein
MTNAIHSEPGSASPVRSRLHRSRLVLLVLLLSVTSATAQERQPRVHELTITPAAAPVPALKYQLLPPMREIKSGNAKTHYDNVMTAMQAIIDDHPDVPVQVNRWVDQPIGELPIERVNRLLNEHYGKAFDELAKATRQSYCDWQLDLSQGFDLVLPPLSRYREVAKALALRARIAAFEGRYDEALADLQNGFALSRDIGNAPVVVYTLVGVAIQAMMLNEVNQIATMADSPNAYWAVTSLPRPLIDIQKGIAGERRMLATLFDGLEPILRGEFSKGLTPGQRTERNKAVIKQINSRWSEGMKGPAAALLMTYGKAREALAKTGYDKDAINDIPPIEVVVWYEYRRNRAWRDEMDKSFALPFHQAWPRYRQAEQRFEGRPREQWGVLDLLTPAIGRAYFITTRTERDLVATATIESIRHHLATHGGQPPKSLDELELPALDDPVTGKPFGYEVNDRTITLIGHTLEGMKPSDGGRWVLTIAESGTEPASQKPARLDND